MVSATLRMFGQNAETANNVNLSVFGLDDDNWGENSITWNNAPALSTGVLGSTAVNGSARYYEIDVTNYVRQQILSDGIVSFILTNATRKNRRLVFDSREGINPPQLVINSGSQSTARLAQTLSVPQEPSGFSNSAIYPNPISDRFTLKVGNGHSSDLACRLFNVYGNEFELSKWRVGETESEIEFDVRTLGLSSGIYLLRLKSSNFTEVIRLLVSK